MNLAIPFSEKSDQIIWGVTGHVQGYNTAKKRRDCIRKMRRAGNRYFRSSALQYENANAGIAREIGAAVAQEGMRLAVVLSANEGYLRIPRAEWDPYVRRVVKWCQPGTIYQPINEPNSRQFTGAEPDALKALEYFNASCGIIREKDPGAFILAPGLTNEWKTGKGKIAAREFLSRWLEKIPAGTPPSAWCLHYYHDRPQDLKYFLANIEWLLKNGGGRQVIITETGAGDPKRAEEWWNILMKDGIHGVQYAVWYCGDHHEDVNGNFQLLDDNLKGSPLYDKMVEAAQKEAA